MCAPFEAPVGVRDGHALPRLLRPEILEQPPPDHFADFRLVVDQERLGDRPDDLHDLVLPIQVPLGHFDLAARQADNRRPVIAADESPHNVVQEGVHRLGQGAVAAEQVEQLVEKQKDRAVHLGDEAIDRVRPRGGV